MDTSNSQELIQPSPNTSNLNITPPQAQLSPNTLKKNSKKTSKFWKCFTKKEGSEKACCNKCFQEVFTQKMGPHLEKCDFKSFEELNQGPTGKIDEKLTEKERKQYCLSLLKTILKKSLPFSLASSSEFIHSQKILNSSVEGVSLEYLKSLLDSLVSKMKEFIKEELKQAVFICLNSDLWSSIVKDEYLAISATYITKDFQKITRILDVLCVDDIHISGKNLSYYFTKVYADYGIENLRKCHVTDQGSNLKNCIKEELKEEYYKCGCHWIQLPIKKGIKLIENWEKKIRNLILFFNNRVPKRHLESVFKLIDEDPLYLIIDNETRWNSTYISFKRVLEIYVHIEKAIDHCNLDDELKRDVPIKLTKKELSELKSLIEFLEPFFTLTKLFEGNESNNISHVLIGLKMIIKHLKRWNDSVFMKNTEFKAMKERITNEFKEMFETIPLCYKIACYFNPSLRDQLLTTEDKKLIKKFIQEEYKIKTNSFLESNTFKR